MLLNTSYKECMYSENELLDLIKSDPKEPKWKNLLSSIYMKKIKDNGVSNNNHYVEEIQRLCNEVLENTPENQTEQGSPRRIAINRLDSLDEILMKEKYKQMWQEEPMRIENAHINEKPNLTKRTQDGIIFHPNIKIAEFIVEIYNQAKVAFFNKKLCHLEGLNFFSKDFPNYRDVDIQLFYLLRYAYGYAYEYTKMYEKLISLHNSYEPLKIVSIGCGSMIDFWALNEASKNNRRYKATYIGIDKVEWKFRFEASQTEFINGDAVDYFSQTERLDADVYCFPKSINEFDIADIEKLCSSIVHKNNKDTVYILATLPYNKSGAYFEGYKAIYENDAKKMRKIEEAFTIKGFHLKKYPFVSDKADTISYVSHNVFEYPVAISNWVKTIYLECKDSNLRCEGGCKKSEVIARSPISTVRELNFCILQFNKRGAK